MEEAKLEDLRNERGWGSEFKAMALVRRSWNMFSDPRKMIFSLTIPSFLLYLSVPGPTVMQSWPGQDRKPAHGIPPDWGEGSHTNKYRLSLYCLTYSLALALSLRNPLIETGISTELHQNLFTPRREWDKAEVLSSGPTSWAWAATRLFNFPAGSSCRPLPSHPLAPGAAEGVCSCAGGECVIGCPPCWQDFLPWPPEWEELQSVFCLFSQQAGQRAFYSWAGQEAPR